MDPDDVTSLLGIIPTKTQIKGHSRASRSGPIIYQLSGWFISTEGLLTSRDSRDHLDWILRQLNCKDTAIAQIHDRGWKAYLFFYWSSLHGHGGPTLSPHQMKRLAELCLEISFDCYFLNDDKESEQETEISLR